MPTARFFSLLGEGELALQTEQISVPRDDQMLCQTVATAISPGTELAAYNGLPPLRPTKTVYPRLLGYMNVARVVQPGKDLQREFPEGTLVYTHQSHRSHFLISRGDVLAVVPPGVSAELVSVAYLYRLGWNAWRRAHVRAGDKVAVVGLGAIGLASLQLARYLGLDPLGLSNHQPARDVAKRCACAAMSKRHAAELFLGDPAEADLVDAVLLTSNAWADLTLSMAMCGFNAVVSVVGFPGRGEPPPDTNPLESRYFYDKQLTVTAAGFAPKSPGTGKETPDQLKRDMSDLLDAIERDDLDPSVLVASVEPADRLEQIYQEMTTGRPKAGTTVLDWSEFA